METNYYKAVLTDGTGFFVKCFWKDGVRISITAVTMNDSPELRVFTNTKRNYEAERDYKPSNEVEFAQAYKVATNLLNIHYGLPSM